jgi:hypothetical protein
MAVQGKRIAMRGIPHDASPEVLIEKLFATVITHRPAWA